MTDEPLPSFREASERFSTFLRRNGYLERVVWVDKEDAVWDGHTVSIWVRPHEAMWDRACHRYSDAVKNGLGVMLFAFSETAEATIATIIYPSNDDAAQRNQFPHGGLKLSAATNRIKARFLGNRFRWRILSMRYRAFSRSFRENLLTCS
jgi:hypothetical protein